MQILFVFVRNETMFLQTLSDVYVVVANKKSEASQRFLWSEGWKPESGRVGKKLEWGVWCSLQSERKQAIEKENAEGKCPEKK